MKKALVLIVTMVMVLSITSAAYAASTGKSAAPGQAENFSKGITTVVTYSNEVAAPHVTLEYQNVTENRLSARRVDSGIPVITSETFVDYNNVVGSVDHQSQFWTANLYATETITKTTTPQTQVETFADYDVKQVRTVSTYYKIKRTVQHHGAPNSNGVIISDVKEEIVTRTVYGDWTEVSATEIDGTSSEVRTELADLVETSTSYSTTKGEWIKPVGTPSTEPQTGGDDNKHDKK